MAEKITDLVNVATNKTNDQSQHFYYTVQLPQYTWETCFTAVLAKRELFFKNHTTFTDEGIRCHKHWYDRENNTWHAYILFTKIKMRSTQFLDHIQSLKKYSTFEKTQAVALKAEAGKNLDKIITGLDKEADILDKKKSRKFYIRAYLTKEETEKFGNDAIKIEKNAREMLNLLREDGQMVVRKYPPIDYGMLEGYMYTEDEHSVERMMKPLLNYLKSKSVPINRDVLRLSNFKTKSHIKEMREVISAIEDGNRTNYFRELGLRDEQIQLKMALRRARKMLQACESSTTDKLAEATLDVDILSWLEQVQENQLSEEECNAKIGAALETYHTTSKHPFDHAARPYLSHSSFNFAEVCANHNICDSNLRKAFFRQQQLQPGYFYTRVYDRTQVTAAADLKNTTNKDVLTLKPGLMKFGIDLDSRHKAYGKDNGIFHKTVQFKTLFRAKEIERYFRDVYRHVTIGRKKEYVEVSAFSEAHNPSGSTLSDVECADFIMSKVVELGGTDVM